MALTFQSPFPQTIKTGAVALTAATGGTRAAPTGLQLLATAGADGALVSRVEAIALGDVTATEIQLYVSKDGGATFRLVRSLVMPAQTAQTTTARSIVKFEDISENAPLYLEANERLYAGLGTAQAAGVSMRASWANY